MISHTRSKSTPAASFDARGAPRRAPAERLGLSVVLALALAIGAAMAATTASAADRRATARLDAHGHGDDAAGARFLDNGLPFYAPRDRQVDVEHMELALRIDPEQGAVSGRVVYRVRLVHAASAPALRLDAVDLDIQSARWLAEGTAAFGQGPATAAVVAKTGAVRDFPLPSAQVGAVARLELTWAARPRRGMVFVRPDADAPRRPAQLWTQGETQEARHWLPCPDDPDERLTWTVHLDVPAGMTPLSNGDLEQSSSREGRTLRTYAMKAPHPIYLLSIAAGPFVEIVHASERVRLSSWAFEADAARAKKSGDLLPAMLAFLERQTRTPYPHARYGQIWVDEFAAGGMENITLTTLTRRALGDDDSDADFFPDGLLAHELAHQWFGDTVTCRSWADIWLNEGFATYYQKLWARHHHGADRFAEEMAQARAAAVATEAAKPRAVVQDRFARPGELFDAHSYSRAGWVLHMLRERLGAEAYDAGIAAYLAGHRFGSVETGDLRRALEASSGQSLRAFFSRWLRTPGLPQLRVRANWRREQGGRLVIEVEQTQTVDARRPAFDLDVEIAVAALPEADEIVHHVALRGKRATLTLPMAEPPAWVFPDPQMRLLAGWKVEIDADLLLGGLAPRRHADARARTVDSLRGGMAKRKVVDALLHTLEHDSARHVRAAAAKALGAAPRASARAGLQRAALRDSATLVQAAALEALGQLRDGESLGVVRRAASSRSPMVVRAALGAAFAIDRKEARALAIAALAREAFRDSIRIAALERLAALADVRDLERLWARTRPGNDKALRAGAILALASYATRVEGVRDAVRDHLEGMLQEESMRLRGAAVMALAALSDPASRAALLDASRREAYEHLAEQMERTAKGLGGALPEKARLRKLEEALEALTRRVEDSRDKGGHGGSDRGDRGDRGDGSGRGDRGERGERSGGARSAGSPGGAASDGGRRDDQRAAPGTKAAPAKAAPPPRRAP